MSKHMQGDIPIVSHRASGVDLSAPLQPFSSLSLLQSPWVVPCIKSGFGSLAMDPDRTSIP
ncbi:MAG: hypothetical protein NTX27_01255 [Verrucomicrobia bacterium]|nr:hypothetical protein [Verrucomicrobiota bacterium]